MMQPKLAEKIQKQTKKEFPDGIPSFGTDAIRFTFTALASFGRDIKFDLKRVEGYRNFCNKLWNASRFVLMNLDSKSINFDAELSSQDKWILSRLQQVKTEVEKHLADYRLDLMSQTLYEFVWHDYCDWYLEISKPLLENDKTKQGCEATLLKVLSETLVLLHPIIPFITEEIFEQSQKLQSNSTGKLISQPFPEPSKDLLNTEAEAEIDWLKEFILGIRKIRGEMNISPGKPLQCFIKSFNSKDKDYIENNKSIIFTLAKLDSIELIEANREEPESAIALVGEMKILIPLAGLIDKDAEIDRLNKEIDKLIKNIIKEKSISYEITILDSEDAKYEAFVVADYAIATSGTVALELSYFNIAYLVAYKFNYLSYAIIKSLAKAKFANLINIINDKENIPELIQSRCTVKNIGSVFSKIVNDNNYKESILAASKSAIGKLSTLSNPSELAAVEVIKIVGNGK